MEQLKNALAIAMNYSKQGMYIVKNFKSARVKVKSLKAPSALKISIARAIETASSRLIPVNYPPYIQSPSLKMMMASSKIPIHSFIRHPDLGPVKRPLKLIPQTRSGLHIIPVHPDRAEAPTQEMQSTTHTLAEYSHVPQLGARYRNPNFNLSFHTRAVASVDYRSRPFYCYQKRKRDFWDLDISELDYEPNLVTSGRQIRTDHTKSLERLHTASVMKESSRVVRPKKVLEVYVEIPVVTRKRAKIQTSSSETNPSHSTSNTTSEIPLDNSPHIRTTPVDDNNLNAEKDSKNTRNKYSPRTKSLSILLPPLSKAPFGNYSSFSPNRNVSNSQPAKTNSSFTSTTTSQARSSLESRSNYKVPPRIHDDVTTHNQITGASQFPSSGAVAKRSIFEKSPKIPHDLAGSLVAPTTSRRTWLKESKCMRNAYLKRDRNFRVAGEEVPIFTLLPDSDSDEIFESGDEKNTGEFLGFDTSSILLRSLAL